LPEINALAVSGQARVLVAAASANMRLGHECMAAELLVQAEALAPLRVRLDPFARELLSVLPTRIDDHNAAEQVRRIGARAGLYDVD
jgi:hypothetical protein